MVISTETYTLYRRAHGRQEQCSFINPHLVHDYQSYQVGFITGGKAVPFSFTNQAGQPVKYLTTGKVYFLTTHSRTYRDCNTGVRYLYVDFNRLVVKSSTNLTNRVFLYLPPGQSYTSNCNLSGYFYVYGTCFDDSTVLALGSTLTDYLYLRKCGSPRVSRDCQGTRGCDILAKDCQPDCTNRVYGEDDGCGSPCSDKITTTLPERLCFHDSPCAGSCYGLCPNDEMCVRNGNGEYYCKPPSKSCNGWITAWNWVWVVFMLFTLIITIYVLYQFWKHPCPSQSSQSSQSPESSKCNERVISRDPCSSPNPLSSTSSSCSKPPAPKYVPPCPAQSSLSNVNSPLTRTTSVRSPTTATMRPTSPSSSTIQRSIPPSNNSSLSGLRTTILDQI